MHYVSMIKETLPRNQTIHNISSTDIPICYYVISHFRVRGVVSLKRPTAFCIAQHRRGVAQ